jgi:hypothetical protein
MNIDPFWTAAGNTLMPLAGGGLTLTLSSGLALPVFLIRNAGVAIHSSYERILGENASYITPHAILILGIMPYCRNLWARPRCTLHKLYYINFLLQVFTFLCAIFDAQARYGTLRFSDEACLQMQVRNSLWNNSFV